MRARPWASSTWIIGALLATAAWSAARAEEQPWSRAYRFEVYPMIEVLSSAKSSWDHGTLRVKTDTTAVYGGGMGVNWNDHLNINTELLLGRMDMTGTSPLEPGVSADFDLTTVLWSLNVDYNVLKGRLTPLITGGFGFAVFDKSEENINETDFSYNVGAGVRWDISKHIALRVIYRSTWMTLEQADDTSQFNGVAANLIFMFR